VCVRVCLRECLRGRDFVCAYMYVFTCACNYLYPCVHVCAGDMICHCAFDTPPLTRKQRANNVKKRDYFTKYEEKAKKVLEALLDKYSDEGIENLENINILKQPDFLKFGSPIEIVKLFGGKSNYINAITQLEHELYKAA